MGLSPMMQQYNQMKQANPDTIIFFRLGDFYEMFFEQAELCSRELDLTLTARDCGDNERAPMCGVPYHAVNTYIAKLVQRGYKVAICDQMEDPKLAKGLVERDVTQVITPGTIIESNMLDETKSNIIANIYVLGNGCALAYADISTGEFCITSVEGVFAIDKVIDEAIKLLPSELVLNDVTLNIPQITDKVIKRLGIYVSRYNNESEERRETLEKLGSFNLVEEKSAFLLLNYICETQKNNISQLKNITKYDIEKYMRLDLNTRNNLEILQTIRDKTKKGSLLWVLDRTVTPMGARKLRQYVENPLLDLREINDRLDAVETLKNADIIRETIIAILREVRDTQRIMSKVANGSNNAREFLSLKASLKVIPEIKNTLKSIIEKSNSNLLKKVYNSIDTLRDVYSLLNKSIEEEPPVTITEGNIIKKGYNLAIDELKVAKTEGQNWVMELEAKEREKTGIKGLKVGFNRVFGYYIEVGKGSINEVPDKRYIRKQTLVDKERYITEELKNMEEKILGSQEKVVALEYKVFCEIRQSVAKEILRVQRTSEAVAILDTLLSFAKVANESDYVKPIVNNGDEIKIINGRHPVVERTLPTQFIPNDTYMNNTDSRFHIITGPNMAGKSTYMRQIAVISYMAQIGSFVPAKEATLGVVDRIFTRVGASDDLASGESTFMVEMNELANILKNATAKSLIVLDEIGRGTSTYDGMAIAWSTVEYISDKEKIGGKTLFATHYHELEELESKLEGVKNFSVEVKEKGDDVIFLRKIISGATDESYGIYVAKLAGIPQGVVARAKEILKTLESQSMKTKAKSNETKVVSSTMQVDMFNYKLAEVGKMLDKTCLDELSAKEALDVLYRLKEKMQ